MSESSLTLPRWDGKVKWRIGKPKRPEFWTTVLAIIAFSHMVQAVLEILNQQWRPAAFDTLLAALWWRGMHLRRARRKGIKVNENEALAVAFAICAVSIAYLITGTP